MRCLLPHRPRFLSNLGSFLVNDLIVCFLFFNLGFLFFVFNRQCVNFVVFFLGSVMEEINFSQD